MLAGHIEVAVLTITLLSGAAAATIALRTSRGDAKRLEVALKFATIAGVGAAALSGLLLR
jgi:hypothetical protein